MQENGAQALMAKQMPGQQQINHHQLTQFALALGTALHLTEQLTNHCTRIDLFKDGRRAVLRKLVSCGQLRYAEGHSKVPFGISAQRVFDSMSDWNLLFF